MADEEKNEEIEAETPEEAPAEEPAAEETPAEDAPAEEAPADDAPAEEAPAEEAPAEEPTAEAAPQATDAVDGDAEPAARLTPKQQRKLSRSIHTGEARPQRTPEERVAERAERRRKKAVNRRAYRQRARAASGGPGQGTPAAEREPGPKKVRMGTVVSTKGDKTITVRIEVARRHPQYEKVVRRSNTLHAHDASNEAHEGDKVRVVETRPLSRTKRWRLLDVVERAR